MNNSKDHGAKVVSSEAYVNTNCDSECGAGVIQSDTLSAADNYPGYGGDFEVAKILTEFVIQIDTEARIRLNEPAYEIKRIEKQVFLTQCRFIAGTDKVFLEGYIRKNIEYAARTCTNSRGSGIGGVIKDTTVHVPFRAYTKVDFKGNKPYIRPNLPPVVARYLDKKCMGKDIREADRSEVEIFNEPVYCELEWSAVFDAEINAEGTPIQGFKNEEEFQEFTDKSVVYLCIKLLQKQKICWPGPKPPHPCELEECKSPMDMPWDFPSTDFTQCK